MTAYPERWDSSNERRLVSEILSTIKEIRSLDPKKGLEMAESGYLLECIISAAAGYEPRYADYEENRSYYDAFAGEIAHVVSSFTCINGGSKNARNL